MTTKRKSSKRKKGAGLPAPESVIEKKKFVSPKGRTYTILRTTEVDEYEERPKRKPK